MDLGLSEGTESTNDSATLTSTTEDAESDITTLASTTSLTKLTTKGREFEASPLILSAIIAPIVLTLLLIVIVIAI